MKGSRYLLLFSIATLLFLFPVIVSARHTRNHKYKIVKDFIHKSCNATSNLSLCYSSLVPHVKTIQVNNLKQLAQISLSSSLAAAKEGLAYIVKLSSQTNNSKSADPKVVNALSVCVDKYHSAVRDFGLAIDTLNHLHEEGDLMHQHMKWMSMDYDLATTISDSLGGMGCLQKWDDIPDGPIRADVASRTFKLQDILSISRELAENLDIASMEAVFGKDKE